MKLSHSARFAALSAICALALAGCSNNQPVAPAQSYGAKEAADVLVRAGNSYVASLKESGGVTLNMTEASVRLDQENHNMEVRGLDGTRFQLVGITTYLDASQESDPDAFVEADFGDFVALGVSAERAEYEMALLKLLAALPEQLPKWSSNIQTAVLKGDTYVISVKREAVRGIRKTDIVGDPAFEFTVKNGNLTGWGIAGAKQQHMTIAGFSAVHIDKPEHIVQRPHA